MLSDTVLLGLVTAIPTTLAALGALFVSLRNGAKTDKVQAKVEAVDAKAIEIHTLTNSNLSKVTSQLEVANSKIEGLQKLVSSLVTAKEVADRVASDAAAKTPGPSA